MMIAFFYSYISIFRKNVLNSMFLNVISFFILQEFNPPSHHFPEFEEASACKY